jgi:hypothetical protein
MNFSTLAKSTISSNFRSISRRGSGELGAWSGEIGAWSGELGAWSGELGAWSGELGAWSGELGAWSGVHFLLALRSFLLALCSTLSAPQQVAAEAVHGVADRAFVREAQAIFLAETFYADGDVR